MDPEAVSETARDLPREPGVYQFLEGDTTLYVGKAVDLRDRVRSYTDPRSERIARMIARADAIDVAVTDTETQALLLEANLIKRHGPRYNVRLRDDKSYPLVQLTDHEYPRIEVTRDPAPNATVFGPFTDMSRVETVVKALRETYGIRGCSDHKFANRDRPCLDYDVGLCTGPCVPETDIERAGYLSDVDAVERFLSGQAHLLVEPLEAEMNRAAENHQYERAAHLRDRLTEVRAFHDGGRELVADDGGETIAVFGVAVEGSQATVARLYAESGQLVDRSRHQLDAPAASEDRPPAVLAAFLSQYYAERRLPDAIVVPVPPDDDDVLDWLEREGVDLRVPGAGREARLVDLALKNARRSTTGPDEVATLASELGIATANRIEGFDVSHSSGTDAVGSNVAFVDGSPETDDYRRKRLSHGDDDVANIRALLRWRAERAVAPEAAGHSRDDRPDPDLLLIDGGVSQLRAARQALADVGWAVPVISLAKADEIVYAPRGELSDHGDPDGAVTTFDWPSSAPQLHLCQRVRDEAHRFARQYHEHLRDEVATELEAVDGIGPETRRRLLRRFGSVAAVRSASQEELIAVDGVGETTADRLFTQL